MIKDVVDKIMNLSAVDVITELLKDTPHPLRKQKNGPNYKGFCSLHEGHSESFYIFTKSNHWNCHGCGKEGYASDFVKLFLKDQYLDYLSNKIGEKDTKIIEEAIDKLN